MSYLVPPAQIPASGITAAGSHLELWRAKKAFFAKGPRNPLHFVVDFVEMGG